ncbi:MAG: bifunctional folylpolyglutamate synthase/dihydrofolate synthase [Gammaproteobacteria bacterium]|nr:bifunctional folylpolyglutamate synthase/dihydrofolate synthase [Gammaproteobacteria bacterium]MCY4218467.1 bifunctional folylpolyglutamate synthase/dihydrofolate synthase [Gammaproteobacteria bacterium]MCY4274598.1 bifunctional folylpolyglutamate synthase/dihydrofolate synthase [Gammaproteobacteria bacterium]
MDSRIQFQDFNLNQWVEYIQTRHYRSIDMTLDRVTEVWSRLGKPKAKLTITVAGTNGKGSTVRFLESALCSESRSIGVYTSPHLVRFNERIRINGKEATCDEICQSFSEIEKVVGDIPLTYFEYATLSALWLFAKNALDIQILEVGMGGRLDAVNIIDSDLAVITSIGLDHQAWLGIDRETIALEKAEIMREGVTAICSDRNIPKSLIAFARDKSIQLLTVGCDYDVRYKNDALIWDSNSFRYKWAWDTVGPISPPQIGTHQHDNMAGAIAALAILAERLDLQISEIITGIHRSTLSGRCQIMCTSPLVILDVAHNFDSVNVLAEFLMQNQVQGHTIAIFGVLTDKDLEDIVRPLLVQVDRWHLTGISGERGQSSTELNLKFKEISGGSETVCHNDPQTAYRHAMGIAKPKDRLVIFGSFHVAGSILELFE